MQKFSLSLVLITALVANFNDRKGEEFETSFGTVCRSNTKLIVKEFDGDEMKIHVANKKGVLVFEPGSTVGGIVFDEGLCLAHSMTRKQLINALLAYRR